MTADEFLRKYNKCPFCRYYTRQLMCYDCRWRFGRGNDVDMDKFSPTEEWNRLFNKEVTE
jgi:hypothetical protein